MSWRLLASNPQGTAISHPIIPRNVTYSAELEEPASLEFTMDSEWEKIYNEKYNETTNNNFLQLNSYIELYLDDANPIFRGYVFSKDYIQTNNAQEIAFSCVDKMSKYRDCLAVAPIGFTDDSPSDIVYGREWTLTTPSLELVGDTNGTLMQRRVPSIDSSNDGQYFQVYVPQIENSRLPAYRWEITGVNPFSFELTRADGDVDGTSEFPAGSYLTIERVGEDINTGDGLKLDKIQIFTVASSSYSSPTTTVVVEESTTGITTSDFVSSYARTNHTQIGQTFDDTNLVDGPRTYTPAGQDYFASLKLTQEYRALLPTGTIRIYHAADDTSHDFIYDGYLRKDDGYWYIENLYALPPYQVSYSFTFSIGDEVLQLVQKKISPHAAILVEGLPVDSPLDYVALPNTDYQVNVEEGRIEFPYEIENLIVYQDVYNGELNPRQGYSALRISCSLFDELNAKVVKLKDVAYNVFTAPIFEGGMGLTYNLLDEDDVTNTVSFGQFPYIGLTRVSITEPTPALEVLSNLSAEIGFDTDKINVISQYYDSQSNKMCYKAISQAESTDISDDYIYEEAYQIENDYSLEDIYSAVCVKYQLPLEYNLINPVRSYGLIIGEDGHEILGGSGSDFIGSESEGVTRTDYMLADKEDAAGWINIDFTGSSDRVQRTGLTNLITDNQLSTGWGFAWSNDPGTNVFPWFWWFNSEDSPINKTFNIKKVKITFDFRTKTFNPDPIDVQIMGIREFTPPSYVGGSLITPPDAAPTTTNVFPLHAALSYKAQGEGDTKGLGSVTLEADDIYEDCQALTLKVDGWAKKSGWIIRIRNIEVYGNPVRSALIRLTGAGSTDSGYSFYRADKSYVKLITSDSPTYKVKILDIGTSTKNGALSLGRLALLQSLVLAKQRTYLLPSTTVPVLGTTVRVPDTDGIFEGVVIGAGFEAENGDGSLTLRLLNLNDELI